MLRYEVGSWRREVWSHNLADWKFLTYSVGPSPTNQAIATDLGPTHTGTFSGAPAIIAPVDIPSGLMIVRLMGTFLVVEREAGLRA
jgi:hypothetical protein